MCRSCIDQLGLSLRCYPLSSCCECGCGGENGELFPVVCSISLYSQLNHRYRAVRTADVQNVSYERWVDNGGVEEHVVSELHIHGWQEVSNT